ncbi:MAG: biotin--[acetyl-CoA-carboxylase] ligase [Luteolibacter sp.]
MSEYDQVAASLPGEFRVLWRAEVSSTNDELRVLAEQGTGEGLVLIGEDQKAGRGRRGAAWFSPKGGGLAFSVLLKPGENKGLWHRLSLVTGLAVAEAVEKFGVVAEVKWPNDVLVGGKKLAGILVEAGADFVIVGIGINVNAEDFPEGLNATSLKMECGEEVPRAEVLGEVVKRLAVYAPRIDTDFNGLLDGVRERCALSGKNVALTIAGTRREGMVKGISEGGELLVLLDGVVERVFQADEVRVC